MYKLRDKRVQDSRIEPEFEDTAMFGVLESLRIDIENGVLDPQSASLVLEDYGYTDGALSDEDVLIMCGLDPKDFPQYVTDSLQASDFEEHALSVLRKAYPDASYDDIQEYVELLGNESTDEEIIKGFRSCKVTDSTNSENSLELYYQFMEMLDDYVAGKCYINDLEESLYDFIKSDYSNSNGSVYFGKSTFYLLESDGYTVKKRLRYAVDKRNGMYYFYVGSPSSVNYQYVELDKEVDTLKDTVCDIDMQTKTFAKDWILSGKPVQTGYGFEWKGASSSKLVQEKALEMLPKYDFGMGYYELYWTVKDNKLTLMFREYSESDMW